MALTSTLVSFKHVHCFYLMRTHVTHTLGHTFTFHSCVSRARSLHASALLWRQLLDKMFISSCLKYMPSRPLLISSIHRANSSSRPVYLKVSSSHLVVSSSHLVVLTSHLVVSSFLTYCLVVPLLVYSSTRRITFQLVVSPSNSSCNDPVHCCWDLRDLGTTTKQSNLAAVEPVDELKECLRASVEM